MHKILQLLNHTETVQYKLYIRHEQYWQIAYPKFWIAKNWIKKDNEKNIFIFYLRKLSGFQVSSTALVIDTFYVKNCSVVLEHSSQNRDNFLK